MNIVMDIFCSPIMHGIQQPLNSAHLSVKDNFRDLKLLEVPLYTDYAIISHFVVMKSNKKIYGCLVCSD